MLKMKIIQLLVVSNICLKFFLVFSNYSYYEITAFNAYERQRLYKMQETERYVHFLNGVTNEAATSTDVVVEDCCTQDFEDKLKKMGIQYFCVQNNVHLPMGPTKGNNLNSPPNVFFDWDDILLWVDKKLRDNSVLKKIVIAKTYEQRDIFILKISTAELGNKMAVFMVAGEEGRDWLSSAILLNYIEKILESISHSDSILNKYDLYFIPILNPDGFVYSKQEERFWAKNRKEIKPAKVCANNNLAVGINIDRNWFFAQSDGNDAACHSVHVGYKSLSEEETQGLSYILNKIALKLLAFINLRGFENLIALPYSNDKEMAVNHNVVTEIMKHVSDVLQDEYNTTVPVGTTANYFYNFSGNMADWVKKKLNIPIVFTLYLKNDSNFIPQPTDTIPLSNQLSTILNITLTISKDIYGSLYNKGTKCNYDLVLMLCIFDKIMLYN